MDEILEEDENIQETKLCNVFLSILTHSHSWSSPCHPPTGTYVGRIEKLENMVFNSTLDWNYERILHYNVKH